MSVTSVCLLIQADSAQKKVYDVLGSAAERES